MKAASTYQTLAAAWWPFERGQTWPPGSIGDSQSGQIGRPPATVRSIVRARTRAWPRLSRHRKVGSGSERSPAANTICGRTSSMHASVRSTSAALIGRFRIVPV